MTTIIRAYDSDGTGAKKWLPPAPDWLEFYGLYGDDYDARLNLALGRPNATEVGTVVPATGYATFHSSEDYVASQVPDMARGSVMVLARAPDASGQFTHLVSCFTGGTGTAVLFSDDGKLRMQTRRAGAVSALQAGAAAAANDWVLGFARWDSTHQDLKNMTSEASASASALSPLDLNGQTFRIGSRVEINTGNDKDIALVRIWSRWLSDAERDANEDEARALAASRGIDC